jgi:hypothetical protein
MLDHIELVFFFRGMLIPPFATLGRFVVHHGANPAGVVSHLYYFFIKKICFNAAYLADETEAENLNWDGRIGEIRCPKSGHLFWDFCSHNAICLVKRSKAEGRRMTVRRHY